MRAKSGHDSTIRSGTRPKPEACNCLALAQASRHVTQFYDQLLASSGLRTTQFSILIRLKRAGPMTINALAKALVMDRTTLGRNILPLEREGLIDVVPGRADRRSKVLRLTKAGAARLRAARAGWTPAPPTFSAAFAARRAPGLRALLPGVTAPDFGAAPPGPGDGDARAPNVRSPLVETHDRRLGQRIEMELKADDGCRCIRRHLQAVGPDRKHREQITVRMVAGGRTRTAVARRAKDGTGRQRSPWQPRGPPIAGISRQLGYVRRDVHYQPVPEPAARGCIRIETGNGKALRAGGCSRPRQMWRLVVPRAAEAEVGRQNMGVGEIIAVLETVAPDRERHASSPSCLSTKLRWQRSCSPGLAVRDVCLSVLLEE